MKKKILNYLGACILLASFLFISCKKTAPDVAATDDYTLDENDETPLWINNAEEVAGRGVRCTYRVFATGLNNPRGLKFSPNGRLYVAEAGNGGGNDSTIGLCDQVIFPVGPYHGGSTGGRISKINWRGMVTTVTDQLPSSHANEIIGGDVEGVADVAFEDRKLYALLAGAGCSHGVKDIPNGVVKIRRNGSWTLTANLSDWFQIHPVQQPEEDDFEPDGTAYSMISKDDHFYVLEPNHGELLRVSKNGNISRIVDISATYGHIVPTALTFHDGNFFIGNLHTFPIVEGSSNIYKVTPSGSISIYATGFTTVLGVTFDRRGRMYVLENTTGNQFPTPGTGKIIRVDQSGNKEELVTGLSLPTAMTLGPDGRLYVSNWGFGPSAVGGGQILQVNVGNNH